MYRALRPMTLPDGAYPHINDVVAVQKPAALVPMLETAYGWDGDPELGALLAEALGDAPRNTLEALLFGADRIERINALTPIGSYSNKGLSILRDGSAYLMVKHSDGGNEHDHFDRLGLSFMAQGEQMAPDIGTVYYGHPLHWSWFKTTLSHNTVLLGGLPHPPGRAGVTVATDRVIDAWAEWPKSQDYYSGARFRRRIEWRGDHFIDQFEVATEMPTRVEYVFHTRGVLQTAPPGRPYTEWNPLPPYRHLTDLTARPVATAELRWAFSNGATLTADVQTKGLLITGRSPDYPWSKQRSTLLLRQEEQTHTTFTVVYTIGG
ncbi:MAG TPA: heparinase II/III family protein, partial [Symbiobacteriaceae bacterium]|nr:heparinase II/III family protein [Symbiobacteriaceae bacterium]